MNLSSPLASFLNEHQPALSDFCARLVQTPSVNGEHGERAVAELIAAEAERLGLAAQLAGENPERPNVIVAMPGDGPAPLLLVGHTDTVPTGNPAHWTHPPFSGHISGGKLFGRGAIDNKGGMAAAVYALAALAAAGGPRAQFIGVPDEESGATGTLGVKYLQRRGLLGNPRGAIYVYPGLDELPLGHRGVTRFHVSARGQAAHTGISGQIGRASAGHSAVLALADLLLRLEQVETPVSRIEYFDRFRAVINPGTIIHGGAGVNIVPDSAEALVDVRTIPEFDRPEAEAVLRQAISAVESARPGIAITFQLLTHLPAALSDTAAPLFDVVQQVAKTVTGYRPERVVCGPANEGYLFIQQGIPMVCGFGPTGDHAHGVDEYVNLSSLRDAALIYALTAQELAD
ncbi:MAG: M20 family peptidase [Chloroflexi bacterium]|nr:MAG: M20 family peptidase [Chloroflexota bacterium]